jgi:PadR family transcriptional regulator PadR
MGRDGLLGVFEERVLLAIARCGDDAYGMKIRRDIEEHSGRAVSIGAVYATMDRLEAKGHLSVRLADKSDLRGGRVRKYLVLEEAGAEALRRSKAEHQQMWQGIDLSAAVGASGGRGK